MVNNFVIYSGNIKSYIIKLVMFMSFILVGNLPAKVQNACPGPLWGAVI